MNVFGLVHAPHPHPLSRRERGIKEAALRAAAEV
jgi:hypothetical protein